MGAPALIVAAGATMAAGQLAQGAAADQAARLNAGLAEQQADALAQGGVLEQRELYRRQQELEGRQRALYGVSGVRSDVGSPVDVQLRTAQTAALDRLAAAYNNRLQIMQAQATGRIERWQGKVAGRAAGIGAAGTLLGTAAGYRQVGGTFPDIRRLTRIT